ncbi:MAG: hypothetical protein ACI9KI_001444 [Patiriisocius sp.]
MRTLVIFSILFCSLAAFGQQVINDSISIDTKYREDQFYFNVTYNLVSDVPSNVNLRGLSGGIGFGFIRDIPFNKRRNVGIGIGAGLAYNRYGQNLFIGEGQNETSIFTVLDANANVDINRFTVATLEAPIELRWRSSNAEKYKFWRVYTGLRIGYSYYYRSTFTQENNKVIQTDISEFQPLSVTPTLSFGFNKINFFASYTLSPFFKDAQTNLAKEVGFRPIKLGFIFYIL